MSLPSNFFKGGAPSLPRNGEVTRYYPNSGNGPRRQKIVLKNGQIVFAEETKYGSSSFNAQHQFIQKYK